MIIFITYLVGIAEFSHVIAGAVEMFTLAAMGGNSWAAVFGYYVLPTLIGNIIGGVALVATINHAQVVSGSQDKQF